MFAPLKKNDGWLEDFLPSFGPIFRGQRNGCPHGKRKTFTGEVDNSRRINKIMQKLHQAIPICPMGLEYLPIFTISLWYVHVGKYSIHGEHLGLDQKPSTEVRLKQLMSHFVVKEFQEKTSIPSCTPSLCNELMGVFLKGLQRISYFLCICSTTIW